MPSLLHQMVDVADHVCDRRVGVLAAVAAQHGDGEVQSDDAAAFARTASSWRSVRLRATGVMRVDVGVADDQRLVG